MRFPLKLEFNNEEEYRDWLLQEEIREYIENIYISSSVSADQEQRIAELCKELENISEYNKMKDEENITLRQDIAKLEKINFLQKNVECGESAVWKGEHAEQWLEHLLNKYFGKRFIIDGEKKMHMMDMRMTDPKNRNWIVGLESKKVKKLSAAQGVNKFKSDKDRQQFTGGILLNLEGTIPGIIDERESSVIIENNLYITSKNSDYIVSVIGIFINTLQAKKEDLDKIENRQLRDFIEVMYNKLQDGKKATLSIDKQMINQFRTNGKDIPKGHLFIVPVSKCKSGKPPY